MLLWISNNTFLHAGFFLIIPLASWIIGFTHGKGGGSRSPWKFIYAFLVYCICIPGIFATVVTTYSFFFHKQNLLDLNMLITFAPILSMAITLGIIRHNADFSQLPGGDRLSCFEME